MSTDRPAGGGGNLRRGLRGSLDLPQGSVDNPSRVEVAGWVFHEQAEVLLVVVLADGRVVGTAEREIPRPDVAAAHPRATARSGWSATVDLGRVGDAVTVSAQALVTAPSSDGQAPRTVLLPFGERTLEVVGGGLVRGEVLVPEEVGRGTLRVEGTADISPSLARVEVSLAGQAPVRARHSLPSPPDRAAGTEGRLRGFSATLEVPPDVDELAVRVSVVATDGTRGDLPTTTVPVVDPDADGADERRRLHGLRLEQHVAALRASCPPGRRILVATHDLGIGGAQGYLDDLMQGLHERGLEFCVVSGGDGPLRERIESDFGAPVMVVGQAPDTPELLETRVRLIAGFAVEHGAAACLANTLVAFPAVLAASRLGIPAAWAVHESFTPAVFWHEYLGRPAHPAILAATLDALASCDEVLFVAGSTRELFAPYVASSTSSLVHYGLDLPATDRVLAAAPRDLTRQELGIPRGHRVLICVGSVEPRKAQLALVRAFGRLGAVRDRASLYIVGASDTAYTRAVRDFAHEAGLDHVHVVDADPDILRWYAAADVLVSAADVESMPRTMLEAMAAGRPVAAAASFGVAELVEDGVSGWLCETGDLAALTELLRKALTVGESQLASMGAAARARVESDHAVTGYVEHVHARLRGWLESAGAPA